MREVLDSQVVAGCTAEEFFALVYVDRNFLRRFHSDVNHDDRASVPPWAGGRRALRFRTPVDAPALIKRLIGADCVEVVEEQSFRRHLEDGSIEVTSSPVPQIPGAAQFASACRLLLRDTEGGCRVEAAVRCTASGPYGLVATIECFMAQAARQSLAQFLHFCRAHVQVLAANGGMPAALAAAAASADAAAAATKPEEGAPPAVEAAAAAPAQAEAAAPPSAEAAALAGAEAEAEEWWDADDFRPSARLEPGSATLDVLALYLQCLCRTGDQALAALEAIDARLARMEAAAAAAGAAPAAAALAPHAAPALAAAPAQSWATWRGAGVTRQQLVFAAGGAVSGGLLVWLWCDRRRSRYY
jgi:hypothetical protein